MTTPTNAHTEFCNLVGIPPRRTTDTLTYETWTDSLWARVEHEHRIQARWYLATAYISNFLLIAQIVIGAVQTALAASHASYVLITIFAALQTVLAGGITYMKGRGQPMRSRAFRDELAGCLNTIKDVETQFMGMSNSAGGYQTIATKETVEYEVRRLAGLYATALDNAKRNYPDLWVRSNETANGGRNPPGRSSSRGTLGEHPGDQSRTPGRAGKGTANESGAAGSTSSRSAPDPQLNPSDEQHSEPTSPKLDPGQKDKTGVESP